MLGVLSSGFLFMKCTDGAVSCPSLVAMNHPFAADLQLTPCFSQEGLCV